MKKIILFLLLNLLPLFAKDSLLIFHDNFGDNNRVQAIGFRLNSSENESVKILLKKENFYQEFYYKGTHKDGEYADKYFNNIYINAKVSQKLFIYSPALKKCEFEFNILEFNSQKQEAKLSFSATLIGEERVLKTLEKKELIIKGALFKKLIKLLKRETFTINYQQFTNRLRKRLATKGLKLFRGEITESTKQTTIKFQTSTKFKIEMYADKKNMLAGLKISFENYNQEQKKSVVKIIATIMSILDTKKEHEGEYLSNAQELLKTTPSLLTTKNTQYSLSKSNFFEVLPLFNQ